VDDAGRLWVEGRLAHVVATADGPVTPVPLEIAVTEATGLRCAVTGVGPVGCEQVVVVVEDDGKAGLASPVLDRAVRDALPHQPPAAVLAARHLPVDVRHNSKVDRARLGRWAGKVLEGGASPRRV
jgi:acyl-coenzyme A synthetase/AMP-(fatty) acid ligase